MKNASVVQQIKIFIFSKCGKFKNDTATTCWAHQFNHKRCDTFFSAQTNVIEKTKFQKECVSIAHKGLRSPIDSEKLFKFMLSFCFSLTALQPSQEIPKLWAHSLQDTGQAVRQHQLPKDRTKDDICNATEGNKNQSYILTFASLTTKMLARTYPKNYQVCTMEPPWCNCSSVPQSKSWVPGNCLCKNVLALVSFTTFCFKTHSVGCKKIGKTHLVFCFYRTKTLRKYPHESGSGFGSWMFGRYANSLTWFLFQTTPFSVALHSR